MVHSVRKCPRCGLNQYASWRNSKGNIVFMCVSFDCDYEPNDQLEHKASNPEEYPDPRDWPFFERIKRFPGLYKK